MEKDEDWCFISASNSSTNFPFLNPVDPWAWCIEEREGCALKYTTVAAPRKSLKKPGLEFLKKLCVPPSMSLRSISTGDGYIHMMTMRSFC
ncbi:unnamed protein product [Haemonchus placei]|uniref:Kringle domain-containing protein n=1 Tax=Haemonchus placei TaxID=6290 RepID=A0A0N4WW33_HAEPC|nr:unnamed protein product [Haemonchus placei]